MKVTIKAQGYEGLKGDARSFTRTGAVVAILRPGVDLAERFIYFDYSALTGKSFNAQRDEVLRQYAELDAAMAAQKAQAPAKSGATWRTEPVSYGTAVFRNGRKVTSIRQRKDGQHVAMFRGAQVHSATVAEVFALISGGAA